MVYNTPHGNKDAAVVVNRIKDFMRTFKYDSHSGMPGDLPANFLDIINITNVVASISLTHDNKLVKKWVGRNKDNVVIDEYQSSPCLFIPAHAKPEDYEFRIVSQGEKVWNGREWKTYNDVAYSQGSAWRNITPGVVIYSRNMNQVLGVSESTAISTGINCGQAKFTLRIEVRQKAAHGDAVSGVIDFESFKGHISKLNISGMNWGGGSGWDTLSIFSGSVGAKERENWSSNFLTNNKGQLQITEPYRVNQIRSGARRGWQGLVELGKITNGEKINADGVISEIDMWTVNFTLRKVLKTKMVLNHWTWLGWIPVYTVNGLNGGGGYWDNSIRLVWEAHNAACGKEAFCYLTNARLK